MSYEIDVQNDAEYPLNPERLSQAAATVLAQHDVDAGAGMVIAFSENDEVQALNLAHRGVDAPTDVLSFPFEDDLPIEIAGSEAPYLGDLVIAYPYASAQAARLGHDLMDNLCLLVVHGTLHLLGYDHGTPEERAEMWQAQAEALEALGISTAIVPSLEEEDD